MSIILFLIVTALVVSGLVGAVLGFVRDGYGWRGIPDRLHDAELRGTAEAR
ncbi:hypothetical protein [Agromyces intestinalis]|uniref:hypothetical protein n=1 Tax=Agromyces intestinalis TaxID=2592652 RepID=UPI00143D965C|nr:hypothetical protein [Agromyces intestinalis]